MSLKSRIERAEAQAGASRRRTLAAELGGLLIVTENEDGTYHAANGKTYTQDELDRLLAECESDSPLLILDHPRWTPNG